MTGYTAPYAASYDAPLWTPDAGRVRATQLSAFAEKIGMAGADYQTLWQWSIDKPGAFWSAVWDFCGVIGDKGNAVLKDAGSMPGASFFPDAKINYAENLLRRATMPLRLFSGMKKKMSAPLAISACITRSAVSRRLCARQVW